MLFRSWGSTTNSWYEIALFGRNVGGTLYPDIIYDSGNTGYYCDPNSSSVLYSVDVRSTSYFYGNGSVNGSAGIGLNVYSNGGNGAVMAFHRGGYYAVNMGLDSDNVIRIGGWSAAGSRWQLDMSGNMYAAGNVTAYSSDRRLKKNIKNIENAVSLLSQIRGVYFDWEDFVDDLGFNPIDRHDIGVIAQEIQQVIPMAIKPAPFDTGIEGKSQSGQNYLTVQIEKIIPVLIEAIKEQQVYIDKQEERLLALEKHIYK